MELWTGGACKAVVHRVVNRSGRDRYSTAFFRGNAYDTVCRPLLEPPAGVQTTAEAAGSGSVIAESVLDEFRPVRVGSAFNSLVRLYYSPGEGAAAANPAVMQAA